MVHPITSEDCPKPPKPTQFRAFSHYFISSALFVKKITFFKKFFKRKCPPASEIGNGADGLCYKEGKPPMMAALPS